MQPTRLTRKTIHHHPAPQINGSPLKHPSPPSSHKWTKGKGKGGEKSMMLPKIPGGCMSDATSKLPLEQRCPKVAAGEKALSKWLPL